MLIHSTLRRRRFTPHTPNKTTLRVFTSTHPLRALRMAWWTVTSHFSDSPLFRRPIVPTAHCSDGPLFRRPIIPTTHCSDCPLFRPIIIKYITLTIYISSLNYTEDVPYFSVTFPPPHCTTKSDISTAGYSVIWFAW